MTKIPFNPFLLLRKQSVAEGVRNMAAARVVRKEVNESAASSSSSTKNIIGTNNKEEKVFWMRDPKTGNWIPENHFGEVDVAELREKFLSKTQKLH